MVMQCLTNKIMQKIRMFKISDWTKKNISSVYTHYTHYVQLDKT